MRVSGRIDFAIRAAVELASREGTVPLEDIARAQNLPTEYVRSAMRDLRLAGRLGGIMNFLPAVARLPGFAAHSDPVSVASCFVRGMDGVVEAVVYGGHAEPP